MIEKKVEKVKHETKLRDDGVELENQFILRLPEEPAIALREALQTAVNLKDRVTIRMDNDLRYGEVRFDDWHLHAKLVDLPTIVECLKTIDNKSFYKTADICQMLICKEEADALDTDKESPNKNKKKDPNKVDKKYLWPHGITPPCKNVRKRRFRKTLKKKNVEAPEIEKEVKRLLRVDNEAVKVDYEIISEDADKPSVDNNSSKDYNDGEYDFNDVLNEGDKTRDDDASSQKDINIESDYDDGPMGSSSAAIRGRVGEHDIFGEEVSSSDDDDEDGGNESRQRLGDLEDTSRLSADDSRLSDDYSMGRGVGGTMGGNSHLDPANDNASVGGGGGDGGKSAFGEISKVEADESRSSRFGSTSNLAGGPSGFYEMSVKRDSEDDYSNDIVPQLTTSQISIKLSEARRQYDDLKTQHTQKAQEISGIQNPTLRQRMQETLDHLLGQMEEKEMEMKNYEHML